MFLITAIPLVSLPRSKEQIFSYFSSELVKRGSLVELPFANRMIKVFVLTCDSVKKKKLDIRKASYSLKSIHRVFNPNPILGEEDIKLGFWLSDYLFAPLGLVFKTLIPSYLLKQAPEFYQTVDPYRPETEFAFNYFIGEKRKEKYIEKLTETTNKENQSLVVFPRALEARKFFNGLPAKIKKQAVLWSSSDTPRKELEARLKILTRETKIIVGTRSSILLYIPWLSLIIVEDEQNYSHKSWDQHPRYDVRTLSLWIAKACSLTLVWGGNIPSIRSFEMLTKENKKETLTGIVDSLGKRSEKRKSPTIVDMREEIKVKNFSPLSRSLKDMLGKVLESGEQAVLLINRRGEFTAVLCRDCGFVLRCSRCDSSLVTIQSNNPTELFCRYCATHQENMDSCPSCKGHRFKKIGAGTQRVEKEIREFFPSLSTIRLDSDTARTPQAQEEILEKFRGGQAQVLLGTQMIIRPDLIKNIAYSAIINLEISLLLPEYNGEESVLQLVTSLEKMSREGVVWQTYQPKHRIVEIFKKGDYSYFLKSELELRKKFRWPPFVKIAKITFYDKDKNRGKEQAHFAWDKLSRVCPEGITIFEPIESLSASLGGRYSWSIIAKIENDTSLEKRNEFFSYIPSKWEIDIEPIRTLS